MRSPVVSGLTVLTVLALACDDPIRPEPFGNLQVVILPSGSDVIMAGVQVRVVGHPVRRPDSGRFTVTFPGLRAGTYELQLEGLSSNCQVTSANPRQAEVVANRTTVVTFTMTCTRRVGDLRVVTVTTGTDVDPDGYVVTVDGASYPLGVNGAATVAGVGEGSRTVTLTGVVPNCGVAFGPTRTVLVQMDAITEVVFNVDCVAYGSVNVTVATTGADIDPDGYTVMLHAQSVSFTQEVSADANGSVTFERLRPADDYHLSLNFVRPNCTVTGGSIQAFTVTAGTTTQATFAVSCETVRLLAVVKDGDIYRIGSNGIGLMRLTTDPSPDGEPAWSSTGKIAFATLRHGLSTELYVMNEDGSNPTRLTTSAGEDDSPSWSPDGQRIVFRSLRDDDEEIYVVNSDGSGLTRLTNNTFSDQQPAWSSTGKIAFVSDRDHPKGEIYVMNPDGSNVVRLTHNDSAETMPAWSPDGSQIAFSREIDCYYSCSFDLYVMNADGTGSRRLPTGGQAFEVNTQPAWSPNGRTISFTRESCYSYYYYYCYPPSVWVIDLQSVQPIQLVTEASDAVWKP